MSQQNNNQLPPSRFLSGGGLAVPPASSNSSNTTSRSSSKNAKVRAPSQQHNIGEQESDGERRGQDGNANTTSSDRYPLSNSPGPFTAHYSPISSNKNNTAHNTSVGHNDNAMEAYDAIQAPFIAIHRPSVAYDTNGQPLLPKAGGGGAGLGSNAASRSNSRAVSPSPSLMRANNSFALGAGGSSNRSFSISPGGGGGGAYPTSSPHNRDLSLMGATNRNHYNARGYSHRFASTARRSIHQSTGLGTPRSPGLGGASVNFGANSRHTMASRSGFADTSHLGVTAGGPAVRIKSPGGGSLRIGAPGDNDSDKVEGESESETDSSKSTSDSSSSASSSTFSVGSSLNFDRVKSYFLRRKRGAKGLALQSSSMFIFGSDNKFRLVIFNLIRSKGFEVFVVLLIVANCVFLALNSPDKEDAPWQAKVDYAFTAAFTTEAVLKMIALGVVLHKGSYFRDSWNILDFAIVVLSFLQMVPSIGNYTALKIFRVLRPLRSLNAVPQLKVIVSGLLHSVKGLANVGILSLIIVGIFSIVGVQLWQGRMAYRCQDTFTGDIHDDMYCTTSDFGARFTGRECPQGFACVRHENPWEGFVSFDNVLWAFLIVFQCITCEGWSQIQDVAMDTCGWYAAVYFILVVLILNYFVLNLALAVINFQFINAKEKMEERLREEKEEEEMELLAAAEEDEDYQRMLMPDEERGYMLDEIADAGDFHLNGGHASGGDGTASVHSKGAGDGGFGRARGFVSSVQLRMLKKTVGGRLIYTMEKSMRIRNLAEFRAAEQRGRLAAMGAEGELDDGDIMELRARSPGPVSSHHGSARNPLKVGSPTAATLALMAGANRRTSGNTNRLGNTANTLNSSHKSSGSGVNKPLDRSADGAAAGVVGGIAVPAITLDGAPSTPSQSGASGGVSPAANTALITVNPTPAARNLETAGGSRAQSRLTADGGGAKSGDEATTNKNRPGTHLSNKSSDNNTNTINSRGPAELGVIVGVGNGSNLGASFAGSAKPPATPNARSTATGGTDDIVRVTGGGLNGTLGAGGLAAALAAAAQQEGEEDGEAEELDFELLSAIGSVDETPHHKRGYLRRKFDAKCGDFTWYRLVYISPMMMGVWRLWLRLRYICFRISEGDPYAWHAFDFEKLRQAAARDLADDDVSHRRVPEPSSTIFANFVVFCVVVNTGFMAASHYGESQQQTDISNYANVGFAAVFGVEMVIRMVGMGFTSYLFDVSNLFDGIITIISLVEVIFLSGSSSFSVLRAFRLLRIFKLMKAVPSLRKILRVAVVAIEDTGYLCVIFLLYLFIAALVGMQLFGTNIHHQPDDPRANFENFYMSFFTVFEILTRDSWPDIMRMTMRDISVVSCLYHLICVFAGDFIILNLFLAILISSFDSVASEADDDEFAKFREIATIKRQPLGTMGALVSEQSKRLLRLADHKLRIVDTNVFLQQQDAAENAALLADDAIVEKAAAAEGAGEGGADPHHRLVDVQTEEGEVCHLCGDVKRQPFPPPSKLIAPMTADELHSRMCARIALRKAKARVIRDLLEEIGGIGALDTEELGMTAHTIGLTVHQQLQSFKFGEFDVGLGFGGGTDGAVGGPGGTGIVLKNTKPSPETVDELFGRAWEAGLLLNRNADDYFNITSWSPIAALLKEEQLVLNLHVGEELVGQSLVAYTRANVPREFFTNGGRSLWIFGPRNKFRVALTQIITNPWFDRVVLFLIAFSAVLMAFENPRNTTPYWMMVLSRVFTVLFTVEALMKIIAFGFFFHSNAYGRDLWNVLDGAIVLISLAAWILESVSSGTGIAAIKVLRTLRCLRPLRVINRNRGLRMVISTLVLSMKGIANVALINGLVYLIFSILGVQLFAGSLYYCNDESISERSGCVGNFTVEEYVKLSQRVTKEINGVNVTGNVTYYELTNVTTDRMWENADFHFDDTYHAFINLLHIVTLDDWGTTMWAVIDSVGPNKGPIKNNRPYWGLYFIVFITVGCFFLLNMFVGVIISSFSAVKEKMDGSSMLTKDQKLWVETQRLMLNFRPERRRNPVFPNNPVCQMLFKMAESPKFEAVTGLMVALNVVFIGMDHYDESDDFAKVLSIANYVFWGGFIAEFLVKFLAYGFSYFLSGWNCFDFFLVAIGLVDILADGVLPMDLGILRVFRVFRILRMLVLVRRARSVRVLLETLWYSLPSLVNIGTFLLLIFFMYAVLGNQLFGKIARNRGMTENVNFENFGNSFLFLIQLVTLDNWGTIMQATMNQEDCAKDECGTAWAPLYYYSFIIIASWVIMNLFVAIILDNFDNTMRLDKSKLKMSHLKKFADSWSEFDPNATLIMETRNFPNLLLSLHSPLGIDRVTDRKKIMQLADDYRIVEHGGVIHFVETMVPMARRVLAVEFSEADLRAHEDHWRVQFPSLAKLKILRYRMKRVTVDQYFGATYLSAAYRRRAAYRYVNMLRDEKLAALERWYEENGVHLDNRAASYRMLERAEVRRQATDQFRMRKADASDIASQATSRAASRLGGGMGASGLLGTMGMAEGSVAAAGAGGGGSINTSVNNAGGGSHHSSAVVAPENDPANQITAILAPRTSIGRSSLSRTGRDSKWNRVGELMGIGRGRRRKSGQSPETKQYLF